MQREVNHRFWIWISGDEFSFVYTGNGFPGPYRVIATGRPFTEWNRGLTRRSREGKTPVKFQRDRKILTHISRLRGFARFVVKTSVDIINKSPGHYSLRGWVYNRHCNYGTNICIYLYNICHVIKIPEMFDLTYCFQLCESSNYIRRDLYLFRNTALLTSSLNSRLETRALIITSIYLLGST